MIVIIQDKNKQHGLLTSICLFFNRICHNFLTMNSKMNPSSLRRASLVESRNSYLKSPSVLDAQLGIAIVRQSPIERRCQVKAKLLVAPAARPEKPMIESRSLPLQGSSPNQNPVWVTRHHLWFVASAWTHVATPHLAGPCRHRKTTC